MVKLKSFSKILKYCIGIIKRQRKNILPLSFNVGGWLTWILLLVFCKIFFNTIWFMAWIRKNEERGYDLHTLHSGEMFPDLPFTTFTVKRNPQHHNLQQNSHQTRWKNTQVHCLYYTMKNLLTHREKEILTWFVESDFGTEELEYCLDECLSSSSLSTWAFFLLLSTLVKPKTES